MNDTVPFLELKDIHREMGPELDQALLRVSQKGWYLLGAELQAFEKAWAAYLGVKHCIGVANGLDALHLSLLAMDIGAGDEVIVPSNTYIASWLGITQAGATVVPVEPDVATHNIDPDRIEAAITPRTKAIMPVHLYGQAADMGPILDLARRRGLRVLEDAAQAHGARYRGTRVGGSAVTDVASWSFYPTKNLGAMGDAGAITTDDDKLADRLRVLRNYGQRVKYVCEVQGYNSRLDEVQAAVLHAKVPYLDKWNARRSELASRYLRELADVDLILPHVPDWAEPVWHLFVVRTQERDRVQRFLKEAGVDTVIHYPIAPHQQEAYRDLGFAKDAFPIANQLAGEVLSLPIGPYLTDDQQSRAIAALQQCAVKQGA